MRVVHVYRMLGKVRPLLATNQQTTQREEQGTLQTPFLAFCGAHFYGKNLNR